MIAIDTNILVHYLTADHPDQSPKAKALIDAEDVLVCTTVLLETEWVVRSAYGFGSVEAAKALTAFCGLPHVTLEGAALAAEALDWTGRGMDFADALHVARARGCGAFVCFDRRLERAARKPSDIEVGTL